MKSFYHDLRTDKMLTENEYRKRFENGDILGIAYFGEFNNRKEAQNKLDTEYAYLKNNPCYHNAE